MRSPIGSSLPGVLSFRAVLPMGPPVSGAHPALAEPRGRQTGGGARSVPRARDGEPGTDQDAGDDAASDDAADQDAAGDAAAYEDAQALAAHTAETLAALLDRIEFGLVEDFRALIRPAADAERIAAVMGWPDLAMRARLVRADIVGRQGDVATSGRLANEVNAWAYERGHGYLIARSHRQLAIFFRRIGDAATSLTHALRAVEYTTEDVQPRLRASHYGTLALVLDVNGAYDDARERFRTALRIADDDPQMSLIMLNNMAFTAYETGDKEGALDLVARMRAVEERHGIVLDALYLDTIARVHMLLQRYEEVETTLRPVFDDPTGPLVTEGDALPVCLVTAAEAYRMRGRLDRAQEMLDRARELCDARGLGAVSVDVSLQQAELHAAAGRYREAYEAHRRYHAEHEALRSAERDARARALQAVLETEEARRDREHYREMAFRDPLTGLHNRRYVDEQLPPILAAAATRYAPTSVALIDLDFFKRINDTLSHEVGDAVLRELSALLTGAVPAPGIVARLGGEEFVVILPETAAPAAVRCAEAVRAAVSSHDWTGLTGALPVTVSVGVTTVEGGTTQAALFGRADRNLYMAKRSGRDRVVDDELGATSPTSLPAVGRLAGSAPPVG